MISFKKLSVVAFALSTVLLLAAQPASADEGGNPTGELAFTHRVSRYRLGERRLVKGLAMEQVGKDLIERGAHQIERGDTAKGEIDRRAGERLVTKAAPVIASGAKLMAAGMAKAAGTAATEAKEPMPIRIANRLEQLVPGQAGKRAVALWLNSYANNVHESATSSRSVSEVYGGESGPKKIVDGRMAALKNQRAGLKLVHQGMLRERDSRLFANQSAHDALKAAAMKQAAVDMYSRNGGSRVLKEPRR